MSVKHLIIENEPSESRQTEGTSAESGDSGGETQKHEYAEHSRFAKERFDSPETFGRQRNSEDLDTSVRNGPEILGRNANEFSDRVGKAFERQRSFSRWDHLVVAKGKQAQLSSLSVSDVRRDRVHSKRPKFDFVGDLKVGSSIGIGSGGVSLVNRAADVGFGGVYSGTDGTWTIDFVEVGYLGLSVATATSPLGRAAKVTVELIIGKSLRKALVGGPSVTLSSDGKLQIGGRILSLQVSGGIRIRSR